MNDDGLDLSAAQPLDHTDEDILREVADLLDAVDPVPDDLVERIQFSLALDEVFAEVAQITRVTADDLAVRGEHRSGTRTESLTFSAARLTAMVTVSRDASGLRVDGWIAPPAEHRVQLRMQEGTHELVTDDTGRFVFEGLPEGFAQLSFHPLGAEESEESVVVTPLFQL